MTERETYFEAARTWADEQRSASRRALRLAWAIAALAGAAAIALSIAIAVMMPLKSVQPYVVTVDRQTGNVQLASVPTTGVLSQNEAVIQAHVANYVRSRETFDETDLPIQYRRVQLLSAPAVARAYVKFMSSDNPQSPLRTLARGDTLAVAIKSVSILSQGVALVRFDVTRATAANASQSSSSYVAAVSYGFSGRPLRMGDRFDNPLGFQVTRYRRDAEGSAP